MDLFIFNLILGTSDDIHVIFPYKVEHSQNSRRSVFSGSYNIKPGLTGLQGGAFCDTNVTCLCLLQQLLLLPT